MQSALARAAGSYQQAAVQSRSPLELVVMLYDGIFRFLTMAREAIGRGDLVAKREGVSRALAIVSELQSTLNMTEGGEVARSLDGLYAYVTERIIEGNVRSDAAPIDEALRVLAPLREAWTQIASAPAGQERK